MTTADDDRSSTLSAAASLERSMDALGKEILALRDYGHRNRVLIWGLVVSLALVLVLGVAVYFVAVQARDASDRATRASFAAAQNRQSQITTCEAGNQARAVSVQLWTYVLDLTQRSPMTGSDPARQQQIAQFRQYIATAYAPRDCTPQ